LLVQILAHGFTHDLFRIPVLGARGFLHLVEEIIAQ
jgi:hypothetical protein